MKASTKKVLATLNANEKISRQVNQSTLEHCVLNGWIVFDSEKGWQITENGYSALRRNW